MSRVLEMASLIEKPKGWPAHAVLESEISLHHSASAFRLLLPRENI